MVFGNRLSTFQPSQAYDKVESEELLSDSESQDPNSPHLPRSSQKQNQRPQWILIAVITLICSSLAGMAGVWVGATWFRDADQFCLTHANKYSPIVDEASLHYSTIRFNGSLFKLNAFRMDAGPEVDAAWKSLGVDFRALGVPAEQAAKSGLLPDQVKVNKKYGGMYPANVEGLHQLHCLNLMRKALWYNFDYYHKQGLGPFSNNDLVLKAHVTHCMDIVRQQLMCQVDTAVLGQVWTQVSEEKAPSAFVDFNTLHTCKNFEAVRAWAEVRQLPENPPPDYLEPPKPGDRIYTETP